MKKSILSLSILSILSLSSCKKDVTSCIEMDSSSISNGQTITFTSCSENELSYDWRINGPDAAPENNKGWSDKIISVKFTVPGNYEITLKSYPKFSKLGNEATSTTKFTVN